MVICCPYVSELHYNAHTSRIVDHEEINKRFVSFDCGYSSFAASQSQAEEV